MSEYGPNGRLGDPPDQTPTKCEECSEPEVLLDVHVDGEYAHLCPDCRGYLCSPQELTDLNDLAGLQAMKASVEYGIFEINQRQRKKLEAALRAQAEKAEKEDKE